MSAAPGPSAYVELTGPAFGDLQGLAERSPAVVRWALKKMLLLERSPNAGEPLLGSLIGWRKLVAGDRDWRVVWRARSDATGVEVVEIAEVWAVGARSDKEVYDEMNSRVTSMPGGPATIALAYAITQLGRLASGTPAAFPPSAERLPDWLVDRLVHTVGMSPVQVAPLSLEGAVDAWAEWCAKPH
jgi:mRNA interferase RelE/StbE